MSPESIGRSSNRLVIGKHSGKAALVKRLNELGVDFSDINVGNLLERMKELADQKKVIYDEDLLALAGEERRVHIREAKYEIADLRISASSSQKPYAHAVVSIRTGGEIKTGDGSGDGHVDACFKAVKKVTRTSFLLEQYSAKGITPESDAIGEVTLLLKDEETSEAARGSGAHTDIVMASALAYIDALNKLDSIKEDSRRKRSNGP